MQTLLSQDSCGEAPRERTEGSRCRWRTFLDRRPTYLVHHFLRDQPLSKQAGPARKGRAFSHTSTFLQVSIFFPQSNMDVKFSTIDLTLILDGHRCLEIKMRKIPMPILTVLFISCENMFPFLKWISMQNTACVFHASSLFLLHDFGSWATCCLVQRRSSP